MFCAIFNFQTRSSDYDDFYIATREEAEEQIQTAKELVSRVEEYVKVRWEKECLL